jgi:hypothetical protein
LRITDAAIETNDDSTKYGFPFFMQMSTNVATSADLIHWEKYPGNPLLPIEENKSSGILAHDGERYRLYTMHPEVYLHK